MLRAYFKDFVGEFQQHQKHLDQRIADLRQADAAIEPLHQKMQRAYDQVIQDLREIGESRLVVKREEAA
ncbi:MAG: hypothetical protein HC884_18960 [Chloroflexaceae bacterium]|nr:hypothetical protein [Chloroflexaceae bacterium]